MAEARKQIVRGARSSRDADSTLVAARTGSNCVVCLKASS